MSETIFSNAAPEKKHTKAGKAKVRTGCRTCKLRRVKCDERQPSCVRCGAFGIECGGFAIARSTNAPHANRTLIPRYSSIAVHLVGQEPPLVLFQDDDEGRYFSFFYSDIVPRVAPSGPFHDSDFWQGLVLRECWSQPALTHAIAALGALSKALLSGQSHWIAGAKRSNHCATVANADYVYALQHYQKALRIMRAIKDLRTALLACILVFCFENYHERPDLGVRHIQSGLQLLKQWLRTYTPVRKPKTSPASHVIEHDLVRLFMRIDIHVTYFADVMPGLLTRSFHGKEFGHGDWTATEPEGTIPEQFASLEEARTFIERLSSRIVRFAYVPMGNLPEAKYSPEAKMNSPAPKPGDTKIFNCQSYDRRSNRQRDYRNCREELNKWTKAFLPLWCEVQTSSTHPKFLPTIFLRLVSTHFEIILAGASSTSECIYDDYLSSFQEIILLSKTLNHELNVSKQLFVGNGTVSPLFFVAVKCRNGKLRREAIGLLKVLNKREGVWDSRLAAMAADWVLSIEEGNTDTEKIPEEKRVKLTSVVLDAQSCEMKLECTVCCEQPEGRFSRKTMIKWAS